MHLQLACLASYSAHASKLVPVWRPMTSPSECWRAGRPLSSVRSAKVERDGRSFPSILNLSTTIITRVLYFPWDHVQTRTDVFEWFSFVFFFIDWLGAGVADHVCFVIFVF
uniref:Uncharacterized protein n=1 Tax=Ixodes scapularis TaxID=6945 RepID=A0A4D5RBS4_IXOSC